MELEKTIMDLLKKYMEENKTNKTDEQVENAEKAVEETENFEENDGIVTPKTEKMILQNQTEEPKIEAVVADKSAVETEEPKAETEEPKAEIEEPKAEIEETEIEKTDDNNKQSVFDAKPKTWQEAEKYLETIEGSYKEILPEEVDEKGLSLERKEADSTTAEEIEAEAKEKIDAQKQQDEDSINQKADEKAEDIESQKKTVADKYSSASDTINTAYDAARVKAENDALKRGLARSSIICGELLKIESDRAEKLIAKQDELEKALESLEVELAELEKNRTNSIEQLNVAYAVKLQDEIDKKMKELQKRQDEVLEYNNKVAEIEHKYNIKLEDSIEKKKKEAKEAADKANADQQKQKESEQVAVLTNYFSQFDTEKAIAELQKHSEIASKYGIDVYYSVYRNLIKVKE